MSRNLSDLHPAICPVAEYFVRKCSEMGFPVLITETFRSAAEQDALYEQGRSRAGKVVTNAQGGQSPHNFGLAFDVCFRLPDGKVTWEEPERDAWVMIGKLGEASGLVWGGNFKGFPDRPHFEWPTWRLLAEQMKMEV
jgi:peptidoglycan L-alanyl-D-glutamate endopeptidase CwlK